MEATDERIIEQLQAKVDAARAKTCIVCAGGLCGHEILFSIAMGLGDKPRCAACLAEGMGRPTNQLRDHLRAHFLQRNCYGIVWRRESEREGFTVDGLPGCLWSETDTSDATDVPVALDASVEALEEPDVIGLATEAWDAGDMSCGDLVLALRGRMHALSAGTRLKLTAHDPGAKEDIPAWCRMTGNSLLAQHHPHYWIQRKE
ncbi:MAG: sulfurtransferase TusA family protein [Planctomycetota bacterium]